MGCGHECAGKAPGAGEALKLFQLPPDLEVDLIAAEPVVQQPSFLNFDEKGRLWVMQYRQYPEPAGLKLVSRDRYWRNVYDKVPAPPGHPDFVPGKDRITIHEDTNGDGKFDTVKVFLDGLNLGTSFVRGRGGVFVLQPPYLLFYPDENDDDVPDRDPDVLLEGFGIQDTHAIANSLTWDPSGEWLYGAQGSTVTCAVKVPGSEDEPVRRQGQMIWRYHPEEKRFEVFAEGGGNIWSCEFDSAGRVFAGSNTGVPGFHYLPGGYYRKNFGKHGQLSNPYAFGYLEGIETPGFKRVSTAICIYEGKTLPSRYDRSLIWANPLTGQVGATKLSREGLKWRGESIDVLLGANQEWFRPVYVDFGPDGALYICDWCDTNVNHLRNHEGQISRKDGRIWRVRPKEGWTPLDSETIPKWNDISSFNDSSARDGGDSLSDFPSINQRWAKEVLSRTRKDGDFSPKYIPWLFNDLENWFRDYPTDVASMTARYERLSRSRNILVYLSRCKNFEDLSLALEFVRPLEWEKAESVFRAVMDSPCASDESFRWCIWWALEGFCESDPVSVVSLLGEARVRSLEIVKEFLAPLVARRLAAQGTEEQWRAMKLLFSDSVDGELKGRLLTGLKAGLEGKDLATIPKEVIAVLPKSGIEGLPLRIRLKEAAAIEQGISVLREEKGPETLKLKILESFAQNPNAGALEAILTCLRNDELVPAVLTALSEYSDERVAEELISKIEAIPRGDLEAARTLLTSRLRWSQMLLDVIESGDLDAKYFPKDEIIQELTRHGDEAMNARVEKLFKSENDSVSTLDNELERMFAVAAKGGGDPLKGREIYLQRCSACHRLHGEGGEIGPELTSFDRSNVDSMVLAIVDPNAELREGFETYVVKTKDGRVMSGFIAQEQKAMIELRPLGGSRLILRRDEIESLKPLGISMMPAGLLADLSDEQTRDFFSYLRSDQPPNIRKK
ncbi:MAG: PVC-type heme-binding CxxCH protein [Verrucomicrobiota bacterium]